MLRKAIRGRLEAACGNVGLIFTKCDLVEVRDKLMESKVRASARAGAIARLSVVITAKNTSLNPEKTYFFQVLSFLTKISKGTIEIINDVPILKPGDKVGASKAALLNMLNISMFSYGLQIEQVNYSGSIVSPDVANLDAVSLEIGYPTLVSVPHSIANGLRNLLAVVAVIEVEFKEAETDKEFINDPSKLAAVAALTAASAIPPAAAKEEKEESESEDDDKCFVLFE